LSINWRTFVSITSSTKSPYLARIPFLDHPMLISHPRGVCEELRFAFCRSATIPAKEARSTINCMGRHGAEDINLQSE
jgi:hypothetical protein